MPITYPALPGQNVIQQVAGATTNGYTQGVNLVTTPQTRGVPSRTLCYFDGIPATASTSCIAQAQTITANVAMTLNTGSTPTSPTFGSYVQSHLSPYLGSNCIVLDMERQVILTFSGGTPTNGVQVTMVGYDYRGVAVTQTRTITTSATQAFDTPITTIKSITWASLPGATVAVGTNNTIGLPYLFSDLSTVVSYWWNSVPITPVVGTNIAQANPWRSGGHQPLNANGNVSSRSTRGMLILPTTPANNSIQFSFCYFVYGEDSERNAQLANLNQSAIRLTNVQDNTSGTAWVMPSLLKYDALGLQYPGDLAFSTAYNDLYNT